MQKTEDLWKVISAMSGEGEVLTIPKLYTGLTNNLNEAIVLKQLIFWSNKTHRDDGYFFKKSEELQSETTLNRRQIDTVVKRLKEKGLIDVQTKKAYGAPTRHFKIHQDVVMTRLHTLVQSNAHIGAIHGLHTSVQSITDNTLTNIVEKEDVLKNHKEIIGYMNGLLGTKYKPKTKSTVESINARMKEGFTVDDFKMVIDFKVRDWKEDSHWSKFLTPETLFRPSNFEKYYNQALLTRGNGANQQVAATTLPDYKIDTAEEEVAFEWSRN